MGLFSTYYGKESLFALGLMCLRKEGICMKNRRLYLVWID